MVIDLTIFAKILTVIPARSPSVKRKAGDFDYANAAKKSLMSKNSSSGFSGIRVIPPPQEEFISDENLESIELS